MERKVFTHLVGDDAATLNEALTQGGFRRSQGIAYRPACEGCRACISVRVISDKFAPTKSMRRVWKQNSDLIGKLNEADPTTEQYSLFRRYLDSRHGDGGMASMTMLDYVMMVEDSHIKTHVIEYRKRGPDTAFTGEGIGPLVAVALTDELGDGLSMVYSFFDPDEANRSLGTHIILDHINRGSKMGLPYIYLGYWIEQSTKMAYKARFKPQEMMGASGWERV